MNRYCYYGYLLHATVSPCGTVNQARGYHYRIHSEPHWPPREDGSKYARLAQKHDAMTSRVIQTMADSNENRGTQKVTENPRGGMERQLFMNAPRWKRLTHKHVIHYCGNDWKRLLCMETSISEIRKHMGI